MTKLSILRSRLIVCLLVLCFFYDSAYCSSIKDAEGKEFVFHSTFDRAISLYPAHTENIIALGLTDKLIGISSSDAKTEQLQTKQVFSYHDDPEKFAAAKPDLVLIRPMIARGYPQLIAHLERMGITVISLQPKTIDEMFDYWISLGILFGHAENAENQIKLFKQQLALITSRVETIAQEERPYVYFEAIHSKMKTFSPSSIAIYCLEQAGGQNIAADAIPRHSSNIAQYGKERILQKAHLIDVFLAQEGRMNPVSLSMIKQEPGFKAIKAIKNGRIGLIDEELVSRPTPNIIKGIEQIHGILYDKASEAN